MPTRSPGEAKSESGAAHTSPVGPASKKPATSHSRYGVRAGRVTAENRKPGTSAWRIPKKLTGPRIAGYADHISAHHGQRVRLYVSTKAKTFRVQAFRLGYYGGKQGRLVWHSHKLAGHKQEHCPHTKHTYMVQCSWRPSLNVTIGNRWTPGDYLIKLTAAHGRQSYVPLTVTDPSSHASYVLMNSVLTWQAWNPYGGYDMYGGDGSYTGAKTPPHYGHRSRVLSYDRPYSNGHGAGQFFWYERPLVSFMEQHGLDVTYWTNITLDHHPKALQHHQALLSLGHDEQWSASMLHAATAGRQHGVNLAFLGAAPIERKIRLRSSPLGPDRHEINYRDPKADPLYGKHNAEVTQNWWGQPPASKDPTTLVGDTYAGYGEKTDMVISHPHNWLFAGTGLHTGSHLHLLVQRDFARYNPKGPHPPHIQVLTRSPITKGHPSPSHSNATYYSWRPSKAGIFATGTNAWIHGLKHCAPGAKHCPAGAVRKITGNLLRAFGSGPAGRDHPS